MVFARTADDDVFLVLLRGVLVEGAVVREEGDLLLGGKVLVAEEDDAARGDEEGELVELGGGEGGELDVGEDGAEGFGQVGARGDGEEGGEVGVGGEGAVGEGGDFGADGLGRDVGGDFGVELGVDGDGEAGVGGYVFAGFEVGHGVCLVRVGILLSSFCCGVLLAADPLQQAFGIPSL